MCSLARLSVFLTSFGWVGDLSAIWAASALRRFSVITEIKYESPIKHPKDIRKTVKRVSEYFYCILVHIRDIVEFPYILLMSAINHNLGLLWSYESVFFCNNSSMAVRRKQKTTPVFESIFKPVKIYIYSSSVVSCCNYHSIKTVNDSYHRILFREWENNFSTFWQWQYLI